VTHRGLASHVTIATGHESVGKATSVPWERLARVVLMCSDRIEGVTRRLQRGGLAEDTPAAVVGRASRPDQEVRTGSLGTIARIVRDRPVRPPALLVVGEVAALARPERRAIPRPTRSARRRSA
jgi:uroporphyrin-III C-methyltransferase